VVLEAVGAAQVTVIGRHQDISRTFARLLVVDLLDDPGEEVLLFSGREGRQIAPPAQGLDRLLGGGRNLAVDGGLRGPVAIEWFGGAVDLQRPEVGGDAP